MERIVMVHRRGVSAVPRQMAHGLVGYRAWRAAPATQRQEGTEVGGWLGFVAETRETALSLRFNPFYGSARVAVRERIALASLVCDLVSRLASLAGIKGERYDRAPVAAMAVIRVADAGEESSVTASLAAARRASRDTAHKVKIVAPSLDALAREPGEWIGVASKIGARRGRLHVQEARRNAGQILGLTDSPILAIGVVNVAIGMADRALGYGKVSA